MPVKIEKNTFEVRLVEDLFVLGGAEEEGPVFDSQMILFSIVKVQARCPKWPSFR